MQKFRIQWSEFRKNPMCRVETPSDFVLPAPEFHLLTANPVNLDLPFRMAGFGLG